MLPAPHQGLIGDDIKVLGPFRIEHSQVMVPGQTPGLAALEQIQALIGAGVVAHQVAQVQDGLYPLPVELGQDAGQGFTVAVNIGDNRESHRRLPVVGPVRVVRQRCRSMGCGNYFGSNHWIIKVILYHTGSNVTTRASKDYLIAANRQLPTANQPGRPSLTFTGILLRSGHYGTRRYCRILRR